LACRIMDGTRDRHGKWNKPHWDKYHVFSLIQNLNLKKKDESVKWEVFVGDKQWYGGHKMRR
jgi:hypothetical protein